MSHIKKRGRSERLKYLRKMKLATTKIVVAFDMQKIKKSPAEAGREITT
jgi:hypothetical protein